MRNLTVFVCLIFLIGLNACKTYKLVEFRPSDPVLKNDPAIEVYYSPLDPDIVGNYRWDNHTIAEVIRGTNGNLIIVVNTFYFQTIPPLLQEYFLRHEEGHIILGHQPEWNYADTEKLDAQASCYAMIFFNEVELKLIKKMAKDRGLKEHYISCRE